jgi:hypothetical protein
LAVSTVLSSFDRNTSFDWVQWIVVARRGGVTRDYEPIHKSFVFRGEITIGRLARLYYHPYSSFVRWSLGDQAWSLDLEDLSRVHNIVGVDSLLDCSHDVYRLAVLGDQEVEFTAADAMLAGAGPVQ